MTSDFWTSLGNESYCGVTGHWITDDWKLKSVVLEYVNVVEHHYSDNIAELYKQFATDWDIKHRIQALVTDNARNMVSAVSKTDFAHIPCLARSVQLSILHGFKAADTEPLFGKCRKIVGHFKHSAANTTELQNCTESPLCKLQQDVPTRWNSIFTMLQSLLQAREALTVYMSAERKQYITKDKNCQIWIGRRFRNMSKFWTYSVRPRFCLVVKVMFHVAAYCRCYHH